MKYRTIVADPPWPYPEGFATQSRTAGVWAGPIRTKALPYGALPLTQIRALPVHTVAASDARLFLWATNRYVPVALAIMKAWRFRYRQCLVWEKPDALNGSMAPNAEFLLVGQRGAPGRLGRWPSAVIRHAQPKTHSQKPEVFTDLIETASPGPYLELFARRNRLGWDTWGNEALCHVDLATGT